MRKKYWYVLPVLAVLCLLVLSVYLRKDSQRLLIDVAHQPLEEEVDHTEEFSDQTSDDLTDPLGIPADGRDAQAQLKDHPTDSAKPVPENTDLISDAVLVGELNQAYEQVEREVSNLYAAENSTTVHWSTLPEGETLVTKSTGDGSLQYRLFFGRGSCRLAESTCRRLDEQLKRLREATDKKIRIEGHADLEEQLSPLELLAVNEAIAEWKSPESQIAFSAWGNYGKTFLELLVNYADNELIDSSEGLSLLRAEVVKAYLIAAGISADRISCVGFSDDQPFIGSEEGLEMQRLNQRVILVCEA